MSLHSDVEALARALGVWRDEWPRKPGTTALEPCADGFAWCMPSTAEPQGHSIVRVDSSTAALILLGHARGLRVDIGECPACPPVEPPADAPTPMMDTPAKRGEQRKYTRSRPRGKGWRDSRQWGAFEFAVPYWWRPCPDCEATGRHTLAWERAILDAMPKRAETSRVAGEWGPIGQAMEAAKLGPFESPGDPATRTALTVLADQAQARGDKLGDALAWWLAGPDVLEQHEAELRSIVQAARLTFEMSNFASSRHARA